jgi:hypothetical protein
LTRSPFNKTLGILNDGNDGSDAAVGVYDQIFEGDGYQRETISGSASFSFQVFL